MAEFNPFDQFDAPQMGGGAMAAPDVNPFDQFDAPQQPPVPQLGPNRQKISPKRLALAQEQIPEGESVGLMDVISAMPWNQGSLMKKAVHQKEIENARKSILDAEELDKRLQAVQSAGIDINSIDRRTGTPYAIRNLVGGAPEQDKLANLQKTYPEAMPDPQDLENFIYKNPETGKWSAYNPKGFDFGDIPSVGRDIAANIGGDLAGLAAIAGSAPTMGASLVTVPAAYGAGTAAGGALYDTVMNNFFDRVDTRDAGDRVVDTGIDFAGGSLGAATGNIATPAIKGAANVLIKKPVQKLLQKTLVGSADNAAEKLAQLSDLGLQPTLDMISDKNITKAAANTLGNTPGGSDIMQKAAERNLGAIQQNLGDIISQYTGGKGTLTPQGMGGAIREGIEKTQGRYENISQQLFDRLNKSLSPEAKTAPINTMGLRKSRMEEAVAKELPSVASSVQNQNVTNLLDNLVKDISNGPGQAPKEISAEALMNARSRVGRLLNQGGTDWDKGELKRLYGSLSEDISQAVRQGGPKAENAFTRATKFEKNYQQNVRPTLDEILSKDTDEQIFKLATKDNKLGGQQIKKIFNNIDPEQRNLVAGSFLSRLSKKGEELSPKHMATQWDNMSSEAKDAMFGAQTTPLRKSIDRLMSGIRQTEKTSMFANNSRTNQHWMLSALLHEVPVNAAAGIGIGYYSGDPKLGLLAAASPTAIKLLAERGTAKLFTSPKFVNWMANQATAKPPISRANLLTRLGRLRGMFKADELKDELDAYSQVTLAAFDKGQQDEKDTPRDKKQQSR